MKQITPEEQKVYNRLTELDISSYNEHKRVVRVLAQVIRANETIISVVVGRNDTHTSALFALTDQRLFHIEGDAIFHSTDEIALNSIVGVALLPTPLLSAVTITQEGGSKFTVQGANNTNARDFTHAMNQTINDSSDPTQPAGNLEPATAAITNISATTSTVTTTPGTQLTGAQQTLLKENSIIELTATSPNGTALTEPVYYVVDDSNIYIMTRQNTEKAQDMFTHPQVQLLLTSQDRTKFLNITGLAQIVTDDNQKHKVYTEINQIIATLPKGESVIQKPLYDPSQGIYTIFTIAIINIVSNV